jgi:hypothetical protein
MNKLKCFYSTKKDPSVYFNTEVEKWQTECNTDIISFTIVVDTNGWLLTIVYKNMKVS